MDRSTSPRVQRQILAGNWSIASGADAVLVFEIGTGGRIFLAAL
jgi:hypothetical protein